MPLAVRGTAAGAAALLGLALAGALAGCAAPGCRNTIAARVPSPDGASDAVVFQRDCGGSAGASTGVAIVPHEADLPDMPTPVLTLAQPVRVTAAWASPAELRLAYPGGATVVGKMSRSPEGVSVRLDPGR